jgi:hypothetical protein
MALRAAADPLDTARQTAQSLGSDAATPPSPAAVPGAPARAAVGVPQPIQDLFSSEAGRPPAERILDFGTSLLGTPYMEFPFGEGPQGKYDQAPLSRFDAFDCETFVETVSALSLSATTADFQGTLNRIRYQDGLVDFVTRNHFTDLDWIPNNERAGFMRDVTATLAPGQTLIASALVDKQAWYAKLPASRIQVPGISAAQKQALLVELHAEGRRFSPQTATVPYVPLTALFGPGGGAIFDRIPSGAIVNIVRPDWDLVAQIGTHLNISHQGFAVRKDGVLYFLEASAVAMKVEMVSLPDYLRSYLDSPTIKGINVLEIAR